MAFLDQAPDVVDPELAEPPTAHIVKVGEGEDAAAKVVEARLYGLPLTALCGHVFIPQRDATRLPMCEECRSIYDTYRAVYDGLHETPKD